MSDCSTSAMLPKEQPKTCGTCYWMMMQPDHGECGACGNPECGLERWPEAYGNGYYLYTTVDGDCEGEFWKPRTNEWGLTEQDVAIIKLGAENSDLKQRYQQLEQVAREMWQWIDGAIRKNGASFTLDRWTTIIHERLEFKAQLEALAVSVDD